MNTGAADHDEEGGHGDDYDSRLAADGRAVGAGYVKNLVDVPPFPEVFAGSASASSPSGLSLQGEAWHPSLSRGLPAAASRPPPRPCWHELYSDDDDDYFGSQCPDIATGGRRRRRKHRAGFRHQTLERQTRKEAGVPVMCPVFLRGGVLGGGAGNRHSPA